MSYSVSDHGARIAAGRLGITVSEYRAHEAAGERWCSWCESWCADWKQQESRRTVGYCPSCWPAYQRSAYARRKQAERRAA